MGPSTSRYSTIAMALHWAIAALILIQIGLGWWMADWVPDHSPAQEKIETLHISLGLTTLLLIAVRIGVRFAMPPPPLPAGLAGWETALSSAGHILFYALMIALPLSGWALVSVHKGPIGFWGLEWPKLPGLDFLKTPDHKPWREALQESHTTVFVYLMLANLALHVAGGLKHQFDGHPVMWRIVPFLKRPV